MASKLSRRQLLTVAGLSLGTAWVDLADSSPAHAAPAGDILLEPISDRPVRVLSPDGAAPNAVPRQLAVRIRNDKVALVPGTKLTVTFDQRLYAVMSTPLITLGGRPVASTAVTETDPGTGRSVCTLTLGEQIPVRSAGAGDLIALVGTANAHLYPYDLVRTPADTTVDVKAATRSPAARRSLTASRPSSFGAAERAPWGVQVAGGWERISWGPGNRYWYYYPTLVSVTGTGPGRTPAATFAVTVDPQVVTDIQVVAARLNNKAYPVSRITVEARTATGTHRQVRWRSQARLSENDQLDVELRVATRQPAGALGAITHPIVSTSMAAGSGARQTGQMSISRADSSWE